MPTTVMASIGSQVFTPSSRPSVCINIASVMHPMMTFMPTIADTGELNIAGIRCAGL